VQSWVKPNIPMNILLIISVISLVGYLIVEDRQVSVATPYYEEQVKAAELMIGAIVSLRDLRLEQGIPISRQLDPNETGLIGEELTDLTTTIGYLDAKRTATNPDFAALMVRYFKEAGLQQGDYVAVGGSGSFPPLILATLCATQVLELNPIIIYSIGSSMYGANIQGFTFVDMLTHLKERGVLPYSITAISMGGDFDRAGGFFAEDLSLMMEIMETSGAEIIYEEDLGTSIIKRMEIYDKASNGNGISCFVNVGGASANFGNTALSLNIAPGLILDFTLKSDDPERGLLFEYGDRGVPVVHLLNIRGLAASTGLPIDPVPLPQPGTSSVYSEIKYSKTLVVGLLLILALMLLWGSRNEFHRVLSLDSL
jgi:poly-gamma-glutamate system protein